MKFKLLSYSKQVRIFIFIFIILSFWFSGFAQQPNGTIRLDVDIAQSKGKMYSVWGIGYDETNVTYTGLGKKLISALNDASPQPVYYRTHNLLNTDDGDRFDLKWGASNVYTEDENGKPVYDWTIIDKIVDTYLERGGKPNVAICQMPKALTSGPEPYKHNWSPDPDDTAPFSKTVRTGYHYPPNDYEKWAELIYQWVKHCVERYGKEEVETWYWDVWDEPDLGHWWVGTHEEYFKLYDYTADAVKRALPTARIGGPSTSTAGPEFLKNFLSHCSKGKNYVTGKTGSPLDYITIRTKGKPVMVEDKSHLQMNMIRKLKSIKVAFSTINASEYKDLPVIIGAADPDGTAAKSSKYFPANDYRNSTLYPSYTASSFHKIFEMADHYHINLINVATWSFTFVDQPWFAGFRSLATNGINKPILNIFRMYGMMQGDRVKVSQNVPITYENIIEHGVRKNPDINAIACRNGNEATIMVWNYHDNDLHAPGTNVSLNIDGIPVQKALVHHYRIDDSHSNAYTVWCEMGAPQQVTQTQYEKLEEASELELLVSPKWTKVENNAINMSFDLPRQGISLIKASW